MKRLIGDHQNLSIFGNRVRETETERDRETERDQIHSFNTLTLDCETFISLDFVQLIRGGYTEGLKGFCLLERDPPSYQN